MLPPRLFVGADLSGTVQLRTLRSSPSRACFISILPIACGYYAYCAKSRDAQALHDPAPNKKTRRIKNGSGVRSCTPLALYYILGGERVGAGRCPRQLGQIRKEAGRNETTWVVISLLPAYFCHSKMRTAPQCSLPKDGTEQG